MSDVIGNVAGREERPPLIRFERTVKEDVVASRKSGRFVGLDVDIALVTPPYSRDVMKHELPAYWKKLQNDVSSGRFRKEWLDGYLKAYDAWKSGQEIPLNGVPIRGWGVISPAVQENLTRMNILTVEDLAAVNDEGLKRIGMGSQELKNKAKAWLSQLNSKGPLTQEIAAVRKENDILNAQVSSLMKTVDDLKRIIESLQLQNATGVVQPGAGISASDILDDAPIVQRGSKKKEPESAML
jgi:hypothetical protein